MFEDELVRRLRAEGRFRAVPLLDADAHAVGLHLHRFLPGDVLDVVQVWDSAFDFHTVRAQLTNNFNPSAPFAPPAALARDRSSISEVAKRLLLPFAENPPSPPDWPRSEVSGT